MNVHIIVSGRVQGVGFRFAEKQKAINYDLKGWVRNLEDGRVELEIEGTQAHITAYVKQLIEGFHPFRECNINCVSKRAYGSYFAVYFFIVKLEYINWGVVYNGEI